MGIVAGTAGHIDHGKSSLVMALTGQDPDRLKEEKSRGITIELGYVFMPMPDGEVLAFIDVPGHERFVRQMVAGVATVDFFLMVVAADEGVMPQTREHLDVLDLLGVHRGLVALTKCDLVDSEMQDLAEADVMELLEGTPFDGTPVLRVSAMTGEGLDGLRDALAEMAAGTGQRDASGRFRLFVDRVFVLKGFGTIVAGTAVSGSVRPGDSLQVQPGGSVHRVRELSVNNRRGAEEGRAGDRVALNLVGLEAEQVERGSCLSDRGLLEPTLSLDTECRILPGAPPLRRNQRVRLHTGTAEVMARAVPVEEGPVPPGTSGFVHFQLESPVAALPGDDLVLRMYSPVVTIGGGTVLEVGTRKVRRKHADTRSRHLELLAEGDPADLLMERLRDAGRTGVVPASVLGEAGIDGADALEAAERLLEQGMAVRLGEGPEARMVDAEAFRQAQDLLLEALGTHHEASPLSPGLPSAAPGRILAGAPASFVKGVLAGLEAEGRMERRGAWLALAGHPEDIPEELAPDADRLVDAVEGAGPEGLPEDAAGDPVTAEALVERGLLHRLGSGSLVTDRDLRATAASATAELGEDGFTLARLRDLMGVSRKVALLWAELMDELGLTVRRGDRRYPTRR